jgi:hypothetical protein
LGEVGALSHHELVRWRLYWSEEPWGAYRDNMHAAMIVSELLKPHYKQGATPLPMHRFMFEHQEDRKRQAAATFVARLDAMARRDARKRKK